ncbi:MAG TPA: T9SS type A sorting domain-containing protein, partial [Chitinophagales bacterium]|nr:T9SS type A sorting domain-containing protein [Chitinophagales bacterium]
RVWRRICDTVYADKPYEHITIGMFAVVGDDVDTDLSYAFLDDVFVGKISAACMPVSVPESEPLVHRSLNVYPNPASDVLTVVPSEYGNDALLSVYNVTGELLLQTTQHNKMEQLDLQKFPSGVYVIQVTSKETSLTQKVVLQR